MSAVIPPSSSSFAAEERLQRPVAALPSANASGVSWAAILAGAIGAAALSLILLILGVGLGLSTVSPWAGHGADAQAIGWSTIGWLTFTQLAASGVGGYLAGRLRSKWAAVHSDEVYFRDTAHGFLAWAAATLVTAALLASTIGSILGTGAQVTAAAGGAALGTAGVTAGAAARESGLMTNATSGPNGGPASAEGPDAGMGGRMGYYVDSLMRRDTDPAATSSATPPAPAGDAGPGNAEIARIFANGLQGGSLSNDDLHYLGQLVVRRTGLAQADAEKRVNEVFAKLQTSLKNAEAAARDAADKARKAGAITALWLFVSLLIGAFVASWAATFGGRRRDL